MAKGTKTFQRFSEPRQRPDGRWDSSAYLHGADGKRFRRWVTASTKARLVAKVRALEFDLGLVGSEGLLGVEAVAEYRQAKRLAGNVSLVQIVNSWLKHQPKSDGCRLREAVEEYISEVQCTKAQATQQAQKRHLRMLLESMGDLSLSELNRKILQEFFQSIPTTTQCNNARATIRTFFKWTVHEKEWLENSPCERIRKRPTPKNRVIEFYSAAVTKRLFELAEVEDPGLLPAMALNFFLGLRPCEVQRIKPQAIDCDERTVNLDEAVAKPGRKGPLPRLIENVPPELDAAWRWLEAFLDDTGDVILDAVKYEARVKALRERIGAEMIHDGARHAFGTHAVALLGEVGRVSRLMGHRKEQTTHDHYLGRTRKRQGEHYFSILPRQASYKVFRRGRTGRVNWPADAELLEMVRKYGYSQTARRIECSDQAVKKRLERQGLL